ncbi:hypothetical protein D3C76_1719240 [compost metagenome]
MFNGDVNHAAVRGKFYAVADDVRPYLVQQIMIGHYANCIQMEFESDVAGRPLRLDRNDDPSDLLIKIERNQLQLLRLRFKQTQL